jgi:hypothetical protein
MNGENQLLSTFEIDILAKDSRQVSHAARAPKRAPPSTHPVVCPGFITLTCNRLPIGVEGWSVRGGSGLLVAPALALLAKLGGW